MQIKDPAQSSRVINQQYSNRTKVGGVVENLEQYDIYENDEMIDFFMDDIDEKSMCEGAR